MTGGFILPYDQCWDRPPLLRGAGEEGSEGSEDYLGPLPVPGRTLTDNSYNSRKQYITADFVPVVGINRFRLWTFYACTHVAAARAAGALGLSLYICTAAKGA
jgi:hypothetical protein